MSRARLSDVATQAGVSEATVSRVLNAKPGVSAATRQAVLTAMDVLGYERPAVLRRVSHGLVGLVVPELENPIFPAFAQVIESALMQRGYTPLLCTQTPGGVSEDEYVETLLGRGVAGIVFVSGLHADSTSDKTRYRSLTERGVPIVLVNGYSDEVDAPFVSADDIGAMTVAVRHLADLGHRRLGLAVGQERFVPVHRKIEGFTAAVHAVLGTEALPAVATAFFSVEGGQAAAARLIDQGVTGIVCGSDLMALGAVRAVRKRGLRVPEDVSVIGFDDSPLMAFTDPPLTTMRQPVQAMALAAVDALVDEILGHEVTHADYLFDTSLIVRASTSALSRSTATAVPDAP
jgi:alanine racemase